MQMFLELACRGRLAEFTGGRTAARAALDNATMFHPRDNPFAHGLSHVRTKTAKPRPRQLPTPDPEKVSRGRVTVLTTTAVAIVIVDKNMETCYTEREMGLIDLLIAACCLLGDRGASV